MEQQNPALAPLEALVGEWDVELVFPGDPPTTIPARVSFEWMDGEPSC
jgi:hypothetical protein